MFTRHTTEYGVDVQSTSIVHTAPLCPSYVPSRSPLWAYHTLMTWSFEHENRRSPSLLNLIWVRDRSWPAMRLKLINAPSFPGVVTGADLAEGWASIPAKRSTQSIYTFTDLHTILWEGSAQGDVSYTSKCGCRVLQVFVASAIAESFLFWDAL